MGEEETRVKRTPKRQTALFLCRYRYATGEECGTPIALHAESPSGFAHTEGHGWLHWACPTVYGPQDSEAAFVKRVKP
jgi:hypothetical protein